MLFLCMDLNSCLISNSSHDYHDSGMLWVNQTQYDSYIIMCFTDGSKWLWYTQQQVHHFVVNDRQGESENKRNNSVELTQQTTRQTSYSNLQEFSNMNYLNINRILCTTIIVTITWIHIFCVLQCPSGRMFMILNLCQIFR